MQKKRTPFLILLTLLLAATMLVGCQRSASDKEKSDVQPVPTTVLGNPDSPQPAVAHLADSTAPAELVVLATESTLPPACLDEQGDFAVIGANLPEAGLEPGMTQLFCATGVPAGETVNFVLESPDGKTESYQVVSAMQGAVAAAVQPITIGADAQPGKWKLTATWQDKKDELSFDVKPASQPFIVLSEPVPVDPSVIRLAIGGVDAGAKVRFAIYRLHPDAAADASQARAELLLANLVQVDEAGRADLALDVADQPSGAYLALLLPATGAEDDPTTVTLSEQARTLQVINIQRTHAPETAPAQPAGYTPANLPPAPQPAEAGGGLPETVALSLPAAQLPPCAPTAAPTVQLWPQSGELGQWWYGCASGFTPEKPLHVDATLGNGQSISFDLTATEADGTRDFRWYSMPEEGSGDFTLTVSDYDSHQATASWNIAPASQPHLLVYPHVILQDVGAQLIMTGFPPRTPVQWGLYKVAEDGTSSLVQKATVKTGKLGRVQNDFAEASALEPGTYMLLAQSSPAYQFAGIETPATAVEFFSVGAALDQKYEFYTLFVGREAGQQVAQPVAEPTAQPADAPANEPAQPAESAPAATESGLPATLEIPVDASPAPTCPDAAADATAICIMPTTLERATYVYMIMQGFAPNERFLISVKGPKGRTDKFSVQADASGYADAHWYALNDDRLGVYKVRINGDNEAFSGQFKVVKATSPHVLVQPRSPQPGTPVVISFSGVQPKTPYVVARYRSVGEANGQVQFQFIDTTELTTGKGGGAKATFDTSEADAGTLFLAVLFDKTSGEMLAKEVYAPGQALYLRYPFAWDGAE